MRKIVIGLVVALLGNIPFSVKAEEELPFLPKLETFLPTIIIMAKNKGISFLSEENLHIIPGYNWYQKQCSLYEGKAQGYFFKSNMELFINTGIKGGVRRFLGQKFPELGKSMIKELIVEEIIVIISFPKFEKIYQKIPGYSWCKEKCEEDKGSWKHWGLDLIREGMFREFIYICFDRFEFLL